MGVRGTGGTLARAGLWMALAVACACLLTPTVALAAFPGADPNESVRMNTPNDPSFDRCEPDDEDTAERECSNVFGEELERFGFAPDTTQNTATYRNDECVLLPAACLDPHTQRLMEQNQAAGRNPAGQLSGVSADRAWKFSIGRADVEVAILDTGIRWNNHHLRTKVALNEDELPVPLNDRASSTDGGGCPLGGGGHDADGDGTFDARDYRCDSRVEVTAGHSESDNVLDASDLIAVFSQGSWPGGIDGGVDDDGNGFVDDIAGWDFFDDDNDPYDASSYSSARNHGSGRAEEAAARTNDADGGTGICPRCQFVPMRVWDTFVVDTNNFAHAVIYAADNGIEVVEGAVGGLSNTRYAREAFAYAYAQGTLPVIVSSDLNTADHNMPTYYDEAMQVQGNVADQHGLGEEFGVPKCPDEDPTPLCETVRDLLLGIPTNAPVGTWFRNSGTTQYGGHAHIVMPAPTGSQATGQASGAAGLVYSYARERAIELDPNEVKQILTLTAEDALAENTPGTGTPDPAQDGWDQHFGYGRPDLGLAMETVLDGNIPPQALITSPKWFAPLNLETQTTVQIEADLSARAASYDWELQWAPGIEPCEGDFQTVAQGTEAGPRSGALGKINLNDVRGALDGRVLSSSCPNPPQPVDGGSTPDPTAPQQPETDADPNEPAFTVRVVVDDSDGDRGEDRKMLFAYRDQTLHAGWSRGVGSPGPLSHGGGEASQRMWDVDGDNRLEVIEATSSGEIHVLRADGTPLPSFNGGQPVRTRPYPNWHAGAPGADDVPIPRESARTPGIGDIDGDMEPELVDSAGEHVYAWEMNGNAVDGFPVRLDPSKSLPQDRTRDNHVKRGFISSPALGDLDEDGDLEIAVAGLDQHLYVWRGNGSTMPGFPVKLREPGSTLAGAESINTPAIGDIAGDGRPEIIVPTNEVDSDAPTPGTDIEAFRQLLLTLIGQAAGGGTGRVYAVDADGQFVPGWPVKPPSALPDPLPLAGPGVDHSIGDVDGDDDAEVIGSITAGTTNAYDGDGTTNQVYDPAPQNGENQLDRAQILNFFENPILADLDPASPGLEVLKGGFTLNQVLNLGVTVGQNLPYYHLLQGWSGQTGNSLPAYPQAVEDYQLLSSPAVADVSDAPGVEAIVGTGLYYVRNLNAQGLEGAGWPKFTGGWNFAVPSVGDVDADGQLEVAVNTREGFSFLWDTDSDACATNDEWWTSRHDEWNTGNYETDSRPPGTPTGMSAIRHPNGTLDLRWTAPGEDWLCGPDDWDQAAAYRVIASPTPIDGPTDGTVIGDFNPLAAPGDEECAPGTLLAPPGSQYVAVFYRDDAGNWGHLASKQLTSGAGQPCDIGDGDGDSVTDDLDNCIDDRNPDQSDADGDGVGDACDEDFSAPGPGGGQGGGAQTPGGAAGSCRGRQATVSGEGATATIAGTDAGERIVGSPGDDLIDAGAGDDKVLGRGGDDVICGGAGDDKILGNKGEDRLIGDDGDDTLKGGDDADILKGNKDEDALKGGKEDDRLFGGKDRDLFRGNSGRRDFCRGNPRKDKVEGSCELVPIRLKLVR